MSALSTESLEKLREECGTTLYRGTTGPDGSPLLALTVTDDPIDEARRRLEREFAQRDLLQASAMRGDSVTAPPKLIAPSRLLIGQKPLRYVSALNTDIRRTFRRARLMAYLRGRSSSLQLAVDGPRRSS